jgi:ABC-2 type transport system ATP-binding protein
MIEAIDLEKSFGPVRAVRGVSFKVEKGEAVGFLGPNGAGKTTTFRMLAGTIGPTGGKVRLAGRELGEDPIAAKRALGYMAENAPLYPELTGGEYLLYRAELKGIERKLRSQAVKKAAEQARATSMLGTRIAHLSKGFRQRMSLADALLGDPPILLLDEPTSGLDPNQVLDVRKLIRHLAEDRAVILSTHILSEVAATCSRAIVIHQGRKVAEGSLEDLEAMRSEGRVQMVLGGERNRILNALARSVKEKPEILSEGASSLTLQLTLGPAADLASVIAELVRADVKVLEAAPLRAALDEVFAELTREGAEK